jgi:hypothetical protein
LAGRTLFAHCERTYLTVGRAGQADPGAPAPSAWYEYGL